MQTDLEWCSRHLVLSEVSGSRSLLFCIDICCPTVWNGGDLFALILTRFLKEEQIITSLCMQLLNTTHEEIEQLVSVGLFFLSVKYSGTYTINVFMDI